MTIVFFLIKYLKTRNKQFKMPVKIQIIVIEYNGYFTCFE